MDQNRLLESLRDLLGPAGLLSDAAAALVYAHDASHLSLGRPLAVALPGTVDELQQVVRLCAAAGVPLVPRGSGTGLSGGAVPGNGSIVLGTGRLTTLGQVASTVGRVRAEAGVVNDQVTRAAAPRGFHFAPDPSSQSAASIGGNIATNAGGPHCLRHGVTLQHLLNLVWIDGDGSVWETSRGTGVERGLDLASLLCGSEGTLGVIAAADLRLVPNPGDVATLLAFFPVLSEATGAVVTLLSQGLLPVAVEMVDQPMLEAVEAAFGFGFATDVAVAMIAEFSGSTDAVREDAERATEILRREGAREVRLAGSETERANLWMCRKKAFGAVGRLAPSYVTMDVVVPLGQLSGFVDEIQEIRNRCGVEIATAFHAGDGNLHPGVHYDDRDPDAAQRAHAAADEIIAAALARDGSATGEHGVGIEKRHVLPWQLDAATGRLQHRLKQICDPDGLFNPGKALPDPEVGYAALKPVPQSVSFDWPSLTVSAPAATRLSVIQAEAMTHGLWLPVGLPGCGSEFGLAYDPTLGELLDHLAVGPMLVGSGTMRDYLLELWAETGTGEVFHSGAPVFKNVAGYDLHHMLCGSGGAYVRPLAATCQLRPRPERVLVVELTPNGGTVEGLADLWPWLTARAGRLAAPQVVLDTGQGGLILVPGRDRPWDLDRVPTTLTERLRPQGWEVSVVTSVPFSEAGSLLTRDTLPPWSLASGQWTSLVPLPTETMSSAPPDLDRIIRQGFPERLWTPDPAAPARQWVIDPVVAAGQVTMPPPPPARVPLRLLRRLKHEFDPRGQLPTPAWLTGAEVADD